MSSYTSIIFVNILLNKLSDKPVILKHVKENILKYNKNITEEFIRNKLV